MEFQSGRFQKTVLEIVQVEHHHPPAERRLRVPDRIIKASSALKLHLRKKGYGAAQQFLCLLQPAGLELVAHLVIQHDVTHILLDICHPVLTHGIDFRYRQTSRPEMRGHSDEGIVLLRHQSYHSHTGALSVRKTEILSVACRRSQGHGFRWRASVIFRI